MRCSRVFPSQLDEISEIIYNYKRLINLVYHFMLTAGKTLNKRYTMIPSWFGLLELVSMMKGMMHGDIHIRIEEDGIVYRSRTEHFKAQWGQISELKVRRITSLNRTLWGTVSVKPLRFEVTSQTGNFFFTPDLPHWQRLADWIIFRSDIEPVQDINEKGTDQMFRK